MEKSNFEIVVLNIKKPMLFLLLTLVVAPNISYDDLALKQCNDELFGDARLFQKGQWSIHGFWPEYNQTNWPQFCDPSRYKEMTQSAIAPIKDLMDKYWFSCGDLSEEMSNWSFWVHEWQKHGTCQTLPVLIYFRRIIDLFLESQKRCYYHCCDTKKSECLIHINKVTYNWTGIC